MKYGKVVEQKIGVNNMLRRYQQCLHSIFLKSGTMKQTSL